MYTLLVVLYVVVCLFLILVVLLQQGKGSDVAAAFGGGSQVAFGPRGSATLLHKLTTGSFVLFVVLCLGLAVLSGQRGRSVVKEMQPVAPQATPAPQSGQ